MIITISGDVGSGKSTVAKIIAKKLGLKHYSNGDFMREMAADREITLIELSKMAEKDDGVIDKELDDRQIKIGKEEDNFIIDSRLGWHFIPHAIKVFLKVDIDVGADRILGDTSKTRDVEEIEEKKKLMDDIKIRRQSENLRYKEYYGIDQENEANYDLIVDTNDLNAEQVADKVVDFIEKNK